MSKQTYKYLKYLNNKFVNKDTKSKSDTLLTSSAYNNILNLLSRKKCSRKKKQFTKAFISRLW